MDRTLALTKNNYYNKGLTLLELLIAIAIFSLMLIGFSSIDIFSRYHVVSSDRRVKLQNDASYVLEHMTKQISKAIGDVNNPPVVIDESNRKIYVYRDANENGRRGPHEDYWTAYRYQPYQVWYCPQCKYDGDADPANACHNCYSSPWESTEILSSKITAFTPTYSPSNDYLEVELSACWDPAQPSSPDNPCLSMKNRISMPAVSTH